MSLLSSRKAIHGDVVVVGKLGRPYGVRGWQVLHSFTEPAENLLCYSPWFIQTITNTTWVEVNERETKPHKEAYVAQINGIADRDEAQSLTGALIGVPRDAIPEPDDDEFFWHDLLGCKVVNDQGDSLGVVRELMETGAHAVLCIKPEDSKGNNILVPFSADYVLTVDTQAKRVTVNWQLDWS